MLTNIARKLAIGLIALTGVGLLYLFSRLYFIKNNHVGVIVDYNASSEKNRVTILPPGIHILLSPFKTFEKEISTQVQIQELDEFSVKTKDNVDTLVKADFTFEIIDPKAAFVNVTNFKHTLNETVKAAFSSAIQELNYQNATSTTINALAICGGHREHGRNIEPRQMATAASKFSDPQHFTGGEFFNKLISLCKDWGVNIINFRIISVEAKHQRVSEALELTAESDVRANVQAKAANSQAAMILTLAKAEKDAQVIRAEGAMAAAKMLGDNRVALDIYTQNTRVQTAQALGSGRNNLVLDLGRGSAFENNSFPAFSYSDRVRNRSASLPAPSQSLRP